MRRLLVLTKGLPRAGAFHRSLDPESWDWGFAEELLAVLTEVVDYGNRLFFAANAQPHTQMPAGIVIRRPGVAEEPPPPAPKPSHEEVIDFFARANRGG